MVPLVPLQWGGVERAPRSARLDGVCKASGDARVLGVDPGRGGLDWKARLGIVLQSSGESGNVTVIEQLRHFAALYPKPRDVDEVIAAVGLQEKAGTLIRKLAT